MTRNEAIYVELARIAALEDSDASQRRALELHRKVLGLSRIRALRLRHRLPRERVNLTQFVSGKDEAELILRMLVRVAAADNEITRREHARLQQVAAQLGVEDLRFQNLVAEAQSKAGFRARSLTRYRRVVVAVLLLGSILWWNQRRVREDSEDSSARNRTEFADRMADFEVRAVDLARAEALEAARSEVGRGVDPQLDTNLTRRFQGVLDRKKNTFVFLYTYGSLVSQRSATGRKEVKDFGATGTGFVMSPDGHVATNKHVVEPWKFDPALSALVSRGWVVDPSSLVRVAWLAESRVMDATLGSGILVRHLLPLLPDAAHWLARARFYAGAGRRDAGRCALDLALLRGATPSEVRRVASLLR